MEIRISSGPAYSIAQVLLDQGESIFSEPGAMVAFAPSGGIAVSSGFSSGILASTVRKVFAQENLMSVKYTAVVAGAWVYLAPKFPGDIIDIKVHLDDAISVQSGSYLAHSDGVAIAGKVGSVQTVLLKEGATILQAKGEGTLLIAAYGGIEQIPLGAGQQLVVDTGHLVAWSASISMRVGPLNGVVSSAMTGEGLVGELTGPGVVYIQTRAEQHLRSWLFPEHEQNVGR
jgi:uncharacterized protein (TIGR00266 family)